MWPFVKSIFLLARYIRRIAVALEGMRRLYEADLESRGVYLKPDKPIIDKVDISYGYKAPKDGSDLLSSDFSWHD